MIPDTNVIDVFATINNRWVWVGYTNWRRHVLHPPNPSQLSAEPAPDWATLGGLDPRKI